MKVRLPYMKVIEMFNMVESNPPYKAPKPMRQGKLYKEFNRLSQAMGRVITSITPEGK